MNWRFQVRYFWSLLKLRVVTFPRAATPVDAAREGDRQKKS
jgi:hypothetical protein